MTDTAPDRISPHDLRFPFSDTIAGYVREYRPGRPALLTVCTADERLLPLVLDDGTSAELLRNLGTPYADASGDLADLLVPGRFVLAYGTYYPEAAGVRFKATHLVVAGRSTDDPATRTGDSRTRAGGSRRSTSWPRSTARPVRRRQDRLRRLPHDAAPRR